jgi:hypothetical protein
MKTPISSAETSGEKPSIPKGESHSALGRVEPCGASPE